MSTDDRNDDDQNKGEGDRESARRYNAHVREFVAYGDVEHAAEDAREAVEGREGPSLRAAEKEGKRPLRTTMRERLEALVSRARVALTRIRRHRTSHQETT